MSEPKGLSFGKPVTTAPPAAAVTIQPMAIAQPVANQQVALAPQQPFSMNDVFDFGKDEALGQANIAAKVNATMLAGDMGEMGKSLNALVIGANQYDPGKFKGGFFGLLKRSKRQLQSHFASVDKQVNVLAADLDKHTVRIRARQGDIDALIVENRNRYEATGRKIEEAERRIAWMKANPPPVPDGDAFAAQALGAWNTTISYAEKRVGDLRDSRLLAEMSAIELDLAKQNGGLLILTLGEVKSTTLPQLQMAFAKYIINLEQVQTAEFTKRVKDMNNAIIQANAKQLGAGTTLIREQMARGSVDIETLQIVRDEMYRTIDKAKEIQTAMVARVATQRPQIEQMSRDLAAKISSAA